MDTTFIYILCFLLSWASLHHFLAYLSRRYKSLPPGPTPLPIVGNLFSLGAKPHLSLTRLAKIHGPVMCLELGSLRTVVISSPSAAKEILQTHDASFSDRTIPDAVRALRHVEFSMIWLQPHARWRFMRKIASSHVFTTSRLDARSSLRKEKISELLSHVGDCCQAGVAVDVAQVAFNTALNLLSSTFFSVDIVAVGRTRGIDVDGMSVDGKEFKELMGKISMVAGKPNISDFFPIVKRFDIQGLRGRMGVYTNKWLDLFHVIINKRLQQRAENNIGCETDCTSSSSSGDVLDALLKISEENSEGFTLEFISHLLMDLFGAGTETTSSTLAWAMAELIRNPTKMKKAQQELQEVVGSGNTVMEEDISKLSYLQAVVKETFRLHPTVPFLVPRKAMTDIKICGYLVPKDSQVLINVWAIGKDTTIWEDANIFKPERFLESKNIDVKGQDFELTPFGGGRRICPGMPLVLRMLPMMLASLVHSFDWKIEDGVAPETINMDEQFAFTLGKAQPLRIIPIPKIRG